MNYTQLTKLNPEKLTDLFVLERSGLKCLECSKPVRYKGNSQYECAVCKRNVSLWEGTLFEGLRTPLLVRAQLLYLLSNEAVTNKKAQKDYKISPNAFQDYQLKVFRLCRNDLEKELLNGKIEVDETYLGEGLGRAALPGVFISVEKRKNGKVKAFHENSFTKKNCHKLVSKSASEGSIIITDGWKGYNDLNYQHIVMNDYKQLPQVHSAVNHLKQYLKNYVRLPKEKYLNYYLSHWAWLYSYRHLTSEERFQLILKLSMKGRALK